MKHKNWYLTNDEKLEMARDVDNNHCVYHFENDHWKRYPSYYAYLQAEKLKFKTA